ncbi:heat-inducible transcription repressor HrcA [Marvinbryantia formatexigens DSM 14469]|uniref:Heat-inducible transcription repressor HrcA n=1 Tax=Marvinbryantia formatexigens DSM 14469 TaxID=478749 RepID=C6LGJ0_9FIRM|nr:heat-inducible transcriptional repressor HrcA [Marvinbryantia formatexigens]EET60190.1 heat-inducible transcription repressor HrcA [Marvinbryantia formatexigens DSM 14469]UWO24218.1 heat-inducible transcriptional repressor HrcA [Marvinbryantia formatexigens DSM 14469]SDF59250.1 heat-inducible transcription repressor HrcA [Marvinbryantia formatexigens]
MQLDDRKWKIFYAIIQTYLETGEPVGSRTISKYADLNLSSATIRNEMADLEEMGLIIQPHTSAGRIPSDKGYRVYVDYLMEQKEQDVKEQRERLSRQEQDVKEQQEQVKEQQELLIQKQDKMELLLKQVVRVLANNTNYATMITAPRYHTTKLKFIQLSAISEDQLLAVIVTEGNIVKNKMLHFLHGLDNEMVLKLNILLNTSLNGLALEEINLGLITKLKEQAGIHSEVVSKVLDAVAEAIQMEDDVEIYTSGATNIFKYPELSDSERASELISAFEEKKELASLISESMEEENSTGIQVYIGNEAPIRTMRDCSVVTATYELGEGVQGTIGIIGPKRMDYEKVVDSLKNLKSQLDTIFDRD